MALCHSLQRWSTASRRVLTRSFSAFEHAADNLMIEIPREHDGLNIEFNWSLAEDDVTPHGDAYRNLKWAKLAEFAKDNKPAGKAVKVQEVDVDVSFAEYEDAFVKTTDYLSLLDNIYAQDGAVGSYKDSRTRVRVITDSPAVALFAQSLLVRVPAKDPHEARPIVIYVATENEFKGQEPKALLLLDKNDEDELFVKVVITGAADLRSVKDAIGLAKIKLMEQIDSESLVLASDVLVKDDTSVLLFNATDATRAARVNAGQLYSAHLNIWNNVGLTSLFGGAIVDGAAINKKTPQALIENGVSVHVPCHNVVNPPKAALFMTKSSGAKSISTSEAAALLKKIDEDADTDKLTTLFEKSSTKSFTVGSDADVEAVLATL